MVVDTNSDLNNITPTLSATPIVGPYLRDSSFEGRCPGRGGKCPVTLPLAGRRT